MYKLFTFVVFFLFQILNGLSQNRFLDNSALFIGYQKGVTLPEYNFVSAYTTDYTRSIDICFIKKTTGTKEWHKNYSYPEYGFSLLGSTLGNNVVFGKELGLTSFFKLNLLKVRKFSLYHRMGIGLSYTNKRFDFETNYRNVAIGSHVNIHFNARFGLQYQLTKKVELHSGLVINHFSNANTTEPNLGLNYASVYGGISYVIGKKTEKLNPELSPLDKKNSFYIFGSIGGKHPRALPKYYYITSSFSAEWKRNISRKFVFGAGADVFYDSSIKHYLEKTNDPFKPSDNFQTGLHFSVSMKINRIMFTIQQGVFVLLPYKLEPYKIYNRGILQYQINERLHVRVSLKSYLVILDYPEIGIGYKIK